MAGNPLGRTYAFGIGAAMVATTLFFGAAMADEADRQRQAAEAAREAQVVFEVSDFSTVSIDPSEDTMEAYEPAVEEVVEEYEEVCYEAYYEPVYYEESYMSDEDAKAWIVERESHGDYSATNGQYLGAYQLNDGWYQDVDRDWLLNTEEGHAYQDEQIEIYVEGRYGSWAEAQKFWERNGWY